MTYTRVCKGCGQSFEAKRLHALYCSDECRARDWKDRREKAAQRRQERVPRWSGAQVPYQKLVTALRERPDDDPIDIVNDCVPVKQRAQLHAREEKRRAA